jgi:predicted metal-dependent HD superfamily phosphohydrolase
VNPDDARLLEGWAGLCATQNVLHAEIIDRLPAPLAAYARPERHYHNVRHVADCLRELDAVRAECDDPTAAGAALLFHDCVYDLTRGDNEERSAEAASAELAALGWDEPFIGRVRELILATKHSTGPETGDAGIVADIDLSILGKPRGVFDAYDRAIRTEYGHVEDEAFAAGRARVLRRFLERPMIYLTEIFRERCEAAARENLARAIVRWEAGSGERKGR